MTEPNQTTRPLTPLPTRTLPARLRAWFLSGVLVIAPLAITFWVAAWFVDLVDNRVLPGKYIPYPVPGLGVIVTFAVITLIGWTTSGFVGRFVHRAGEDIVKRIPVIRTIYGGTKQVFESVLAGALQRLPAGRNLRVSAPRHLVDRLPHRGDLGGGAGENPAGNGECLRPHDAESDLGLSPLRAARRPDSARYDHRGGHQDGRLRRYRHTALVAHQIQPAGSRRGAGFARRLSTCDDRSNKPRANRRIFGCAAGGNR